MASATEPALDADGVEEGGSHKDALWLQHVQAELLPPVEVLIKRVLSDVVLAQTRAIGRVLSRHLLGALLWRMLWQSQRSRLSHPRPLAGTWGLLGELQRVRAIMLLGSSAMAAWSDHLCSRLNAGITLSDDAPAARLAMFDLNVRLHSCLEAALPLDPSLPAPGCVMCCCERA